MPEPVYVTESEKWFAHYLHAAGLPFSKPTIAATGKRPDFHVATPAGPVIVEVSEIQQDLCWGTPDEDGVEWATAPDWAKKIRKKLKRKNGQVDATGAPNVLLLAFPRASADWSDFVQAMFGKMAVRFPIGDSGGESQTVFTLHGAAMQRGVNTRWSAIGCLSLVNPTYPAVTDELARMRAVRGPGADLAEAAARAAEALSSPDWDGSALTPRLEIFENPYAARPLPDHLAHGVWDARWRHDGDQSFVRVYPRVRPPEYRAGWHPYPGTAPAPTR